MFLKIILKIYFSMIEPLGIHTKHSGIESYALMRFEAILLQVNRNAFRNTGILLGKIIQIAWGIQESKY